MKKYIVLIALVILFGFTWAFRNPLYKIYRDITERKEEIKAPIDNSYARSYDFNYVKHTDNFIASSYNDVLDIYYTALNSGVNSFSFYCKEDSKCLTHVKEIANDQRVLSNINNFVHPFNGFKHIESIYDDYGKVTITITHTYSNSDIELISAKVKEIEASIWNDSMTIEDKIKEAHNYIINNSKYDKKRSDEKIVTYKSDTAFGTLLQGYSLCGGYTDAMTLFLEDLKIKNYKVSSENHVWNAVNLNNAWYHLDLTWDDPITSDNSDILEYNFFLITTDELTALEVEQHQYDSSVYSELQ